MSQPEKHINLRVPERLLDRIDQRAAEVGVKSRNAWIVGALAWACRQAPTDQITSIETTRV